MKRVHKFYLVFLFLFSSLAGMSQSNKPENPNSIGTPGNNTENTQLKEFLKNEAKEYEPAKKIEESLSLREKAEKERVEKEKTQKEKREKEKREKEKNEKGNKK